MRARTDICVPQKWKAKQSKNKFLFGRSPNGGRRRAKLPVYHKIRSLLYVKGTCSGARKFFFEMFKAIKLVALNLPENIRFLFMHYFVTGNRKELLVVFFCLFVSKGKRKSCYNVQELNCQNHSRVFQSMSSFPSSQFLVHSYSTFSKTGYLWLYQSKRQK